MFGSVLIANRGEIAVRIERTLRDLGVRSIAVHSDVDPSALHVRLADEAIALAGSSASATYANVDAVVAAAIRSGAEAVHPGYGFLAENALFGQAVIDAGLAWVGPPPEALRTVGDKVRARELARSAGVPVVPGLFHAAEGPEEISAFADEHGYPVAIKAAGGGGGRGFRVAAGPHEVAAGFETARRESVAYFGSADVYVERYLAQPKHLEVQVLSPGPDEALWLGVRDCSLQRRHQKLVEETPPAVPAREAEMGEAAVALAKACGYVGAGTVEMLVDADNFYFLEMNARLQVEHTVTEEVLGVDLVACQLRVASGDPLDFGQADLRPRGHAIECRLNAEDPERAFAPTPGTITRFVAPGGPGVRVDAGYDWGDEVPQEYDSLIAKIVVWGATREAARARMLRALHETVIEGVATTIPAHRQLLGSEAFRAGTHTTRTVEKAGLGESDGRAGDLSDAARHDGGRSVLLWHPAMAASARGSVEAPSSGEVLAPMQGTIVKTLVSEGAHVEAGDPVVVLEAMKMETTLAAPATGEVKEMLVGAGDTVGAGQPLVRVG